MEEIRIEKKKPVWPWIIGLLIIAAIAYYFVFMNDDEVVERDTVVTTTAVESNVIDNGSEVNDYVNYIADPKMGLDHDYTSGAITRLVDATRATADAVDVDTEADLSQAKTFADEITQDPQSLDHANKIKSAAQSINVALSKIQKEKFPQLEPDYNEVAQAADNIDTSTPTLQQKDAVKTYFENAANLLTKINNDHGK